MDPLLPLLFTPHGGLPASTLAGFADASSRRLAELGLESPLDRAIAAGALARCVGHAFAGGYREALRALVPSLPRDALAALCATEEGGAHPKAIQTRLTRRDDGGLELRGVKRWATAAGDAARLFVVASTGADEQGRNRLALVEVRTDQPGLRLVPMPTPPFAPEVPHFEVHLDGVVVEPSAVLPGDGYERYLKPFRTVEDVHVMSALAAYALAEASRLGLDQGTRAELWAVLGALRPVASAVASPAAHLALDGALRLLRGSLGRLEEPWGRSGADSFALWQRDRMLLEVAGKARAARADAAWKAITSSG